MDKKFALKAILIALLIIFTCITSNAQMRYTNTLVVEGINKSGQVEKIEIPLQKPTYDFTDAQKKNILDKESQGFSQYSESANLVSKPYPSSNCAGYVLFKLFNDIGKWKSDESQIKKLTDAFYTPVLPALYENYEKPSYEYQEGDIVVYENFMHFAIVTSNNPVTLEGKNNEGAVFKYTPGQENGQYGKPTCYRIDSHATITGHHLKNADDYLEVTYPPKNIICPSVPTVDCAVSCLAPISQEDSVQVIPPDLPVQAYHYDWIEKPFAYIKSRDVPNSGTGDAGNPKIITRTYRASYLPNVWNAPSNLYKECTQTITLECPGNEKNCSGTCCKPGESCIGGSCSPNLLVLRSGDASDSWREETWICPAWGNPIGDPQANWTWSSPQGVNDPSGGEVQTYTRSFYVDGPPSSGVLTMTCDNGYQVFLNDQEVGIDGLNRADIPWDTAEKRHNLGGGWKSAKTYDVTNKLRQGANTLRIICVNYVAPGAMKNEDNPAGLLYRLEVSWG